MKEIKATLEKRLEFLNGLPSTTENLCRISELLQSIIVIQNQILKNLNQQQYN